MWPLLLLVPIKEVWPLGASPREVGIYLSVSPSDGGVAFTCQSLVKWCGCCAYWFQKRRRGLCMSVSLKELWSYVSVLAREVWPFYVSHCERSIATLFIGSIKEGMAFVCQ